MTSNATPSRPSSNAGLQHREPLSQPSSNAGRLPETARTPERVMDDLQYQSNEQHADEGGDKDNDVDDKDEEYEDDGVKGHESEGDIPDDLDARLEPVWILNNVDQEIRHAQIKNKATLFVEDAMDHKDESIDRQSDQYLLLVVKTAGHLAKRYKQIKAAKENDRSYTPMSQILGTTGSLIYSDVLEKLGNHPNVTVRHKVGRAELWVDRVAYQKMQNEGIRDKGESHIEDQGITFDGHIAKEAMQTPQMLPDNTSLPPPRVKNEATSLPPKEIPGYAQPRVREPRRSPLAKETSPNMRGFSMPRTNRDDMDEPGIPEAKLVHKKAMEDRLVKLMDETLAIQMVFPAGFKFNQKMDTSEKYAGSPKFADLENWLSSLCYRFAVRQMGGPELDRVRTMLLIEHLEGEALQFYSRHVTNVKRSKFNWTFETVILALYERFVHPSSMQDAREGFKKAKFIANKGVQGFYDILLEYAQNMYEWPDEYTILEAFLDGIPEYIRIHLLRDKGLSPEMHSISDFVSYAVRYEDRVKTLNYYQKKHTSTTTDTTPRIRDAREASRPLRPFQQSRPLDPIAIRAYDSRELQIKPKSDWRAREHNAQHNAQQWKRLLCDENEELHPQGDVKAAKKTEPKKDTYHKEQVPLKEKHPQATPHTEKNISVQATVNGSSSYCQPTSSKTKIEDLITDEMEEKVNQQTIAQENNRKTTRRFWDRPIEVFTLPH
ncbi:hypothetical protein CVT25_003782, partial [Psilocybe cyanescens]